MCIYICLLVALRSHVATSLSQRSHQIPLPPPLSDKMVPHYQSVLILGSSVDRYAIHDNYPGESFIHDAEKLQHNIVHDVSRNVSIAVLQHPGVGLNGDLNAPFWKLNKKLHNVSNGARIPRGGQPDHPDKNIRQWKYEPTWQVIKYAPKFGRRVFGANPPGLVVVETSLWDLAGWWQITGHQATPERLEQWCDKDLPFLLKAVTDVFSQSRVVFRTAPQVAPWSTERWTQENFEAMHQCVERRSAGTGEVFEHVGVIDYHEIMDQLILRKSSGEELGLWKRDGYHPANLPSRLYLNQIFKLLGVPPLEDTPPSDTFRDKAPSVDDEFSS